MKTSARPTGARGHAKLLVLGLTVLPLVGCKKAHGTHEPGVDVRDWTLAEIEAELERNDHVLADEGIMIAMASPATPPVDEPGSELEGQPEAHDDDAGQAPEPAPPEPAPTVASEPYYGDHEAAMAEAEPTRRDKGQRRVAQRASNRDAPTRCERVCELAAATCELETQICALAERHPDEPRYAQACERAEQQCVAASQACERCED